jgi:hypothetical protein
VIRTRSGRPGAIGSEGLLLFGLVADDGTSVRPEGCETVLLRDIHAIVQRVPPRRLDASTQAITEYRAVVEGVQRDRSILPAPFGTVFRSRDSLVRWMELHYVALREGLGFIQGRQAARLLLAALPSTPTSEYEATVFESMKFLRRHADATLVLPDASDGKPRTTEAAFLVQRDKWSAFADAVRDEQERLDGVTIEQSGPWPAYDFVHLQFGS